MSVNRYLIEYRQVPPFDILRCLLLYSRWAFNRHNQKDCCIDNCCYPLNWWINHIVLWNLIQANRMLQYYLYSRHSPQTYIRQTLFLSQKKRRNQMKKMLFFSFLNNYWFSCYCSFFRLHRMGWYLLAFCCDNFIFASGLFSTADFGFCLFFFFF
jgi:hypothetical protein